VDQHEHNKALVERDAHTIEKSPSKTNFDGIEVAFSTYYSLLFFFFFFVFLIDIRDVELSVCLMIIIIIINK
jgi:hypothetical protein